MHGIAGFFDIFSTSLFNIKKWRYVLNNINNKQMSTVKIEEFVFLYKNCGLFYFDNSAKEGKNNIGSINRKFLSKKHIIVYDGKIYNYLELKEKLIEKGVVFNTKFEVEVILKGHLIFGEEFVKKLNGVFCYAILDYSNVELTIYRDSFGVKPIFYMLQEGNLIFSSKIEILHKFLNLKQKKNKETIFEIFDGHYLKISKKFIKQKKF